MKDIQSQPDHRRINIKKVGVKDISYPITVLDKAERHQKTIAKVNMYVSLPHHFKGTHMSRFIEILNRFHGDINIQSFHRILEEMKAKLQAEAAHMEIEFPYFLKKKFPHPNSSEMAKYICRMHGSLTDKDNLTLNVKVPISPPLPSQTYHGLPRSLGNWGIADISLQFKHFFWIEDLIQMVEEVTSYHLAKPEDPRDDEANSSLTVEALTKSLGNKLKTHPDIKWFSVLVENLSEGFSTFASLEWPETTQN
ncbi:MAG: GTP cyclohydrolase I FolE2 [Proteobacteria bacterium]|nr:GTP cyclohydrolase I FolE2 [Pseudomonadota bacterium]MBU1708866.1 GTP cyclohydrolase I FolE2 [Pseudomonadota bacterium]